jgi:restriction system protein
VQDASRFEKAIFNWFSKQSDLVAVASPFVIFFVVLGLGLSLLSLAFHMSLWPPTAFASWLLVAVTLAGIGLYLTAIFALSAVFVRSRRFQLLQLHQTMRDIQAMSWREFEELVVSYFEANNYQADHVGRDTADGGVDAVISKDGQTWLVQCKHYRSQWIEERPLRELLGLVSSRKSAGGIFVACGVFGDDALAFAKANPELQLIGGQQLRDLVEETVRRRNGAASTLCPICGGPMRTAQGRYGPFLGCANYPACKGWRRLPDQAIA